MWNELRRRYVNREMLFWLAGAVISQEVLLTVFLRTLQRNVSGTPCVLDVLTCMSQNYVFPLMMIIAAVCNQRMMKCDRDPMIILKYSSRAGIYLWQSICTIIFSSDVISGVAVIIFAGVDIFIPLTYHKLIIFGAAWYSSGECSRKLGIAALIMAVLIIAGLILQRKREYYEYKKEDE